MIDQYFNFAYTSDLLIFAIDSKTNTNCRFLPNKYFSILLVKRKKDPYINKWCLPGGFVLNNETSLDASLRILKKETNLNNFYLEQVASFDDVSRDPRGRIISTSYMALVDKSKIKQKIDDDASWFKVQINENDEIIEINLDNDVDKINILLKKKLKSISTNEYSYEIISSNNIAFDHGLIINKGIEILKNKVNNTDIVFNLMPKEFTIGELKQVYELLLGKKLVNSAFRRTIASKIVATDTIIKNGGFRPPTLYKYKGDK